MPLKPVYNVTFETPRGTVQVNEQYYSLTDIQQDAEELDYKIQTVDIVRLVYEEDKQS